MSVAKTIGERVLRIRLAEPFTNKQFLKLGSRASVDKVLSRLVSERVIQRIIRGVLMRPKANRFVGTVTPEVREVVEVIAKDRGEVIQVQGAVAVNLFELSTQVPVLPVFIPAGQVGSSGLATCRFSSGMSAAGSFRWLARHLEWQFLLCGIWGKTT